MILEALAVIGLDPVSEDALENLRKAAEILRRDHGVKLLVIPVNTWREPISASLKSLPAIYIGGSRAFVGYAPEVEEVVDYVLRLARGGGAKEAEVLVPAGIIDNDPMSSPVAMA